MPATLTYRPLTPQNPAEFLRPYPSIYARYAEIHSVQPLKGLPGTRATDVSNRASVPGGAGTGHRICTGASVSRRTAHYSLLTANSTFTFSAKEKDSETGLSYFGSRYYNSDLSIWLSVDPMSDKYPSLSSYVYCANNPVKLVDPNGEDYEIVIKGNNLIVKANYYTSDANKKDLQEALDLWNNQNGFSYVTGKGKNQKVYNIRFELTIAKGNFTDEKSTMGSENFHSGIDNFLAYSDNIFNENKEPIDGEATNNLIHIRPEASIRTIAHEVGHTLGIGDWTIPGPESEDHGQLMTSGGSSDVINRNHVATILSNKGYKTNSFTWGVIINRNENFFPLSKKMSGTVKFN